MKKKKKFNLILLIFAIILVLGLGYAYLSTTLSINGTADVDSNTWNVYWDNVQVTSGSVTGSQVTQAPTIDTNKTTVSFQVRLSKPGDYYEFTVDAKNTGSIDAMIDTITKTTSIPDYLKYEVTYNDDIPIEENHKLSANDTQTYKVKVEYKTDINANQLPSSNQSISFSFGTNYIQADGNAYAKPYYIYTTSNVIASIGSEVPDNYGETDDFDLVVNSIGDNIATFLRHKVLNGIIIESYVGFRLPSHASASGLKPGFYYIKGGDGGASYQENRSVLLKSFTAANCNEDENGINCIFPYPHAGIDGYVYFVSSGGNGCRIEENGNSYCVS